MTEKDYIKATNRVKVSMALTILRDVLVCEENGLDEKEFAEVKASLARMEERFFSEIELVE